MADRYKIRKHEGTPLFKARVGAGTSDINLLIGEAEFDALMNHMSVAEKVGLRRNSHIRTAMTALGRNISNYLTREQLEEVFPMHHTLPPGVSSTKVNEILAELAVEIQHPISKKQNVVTKIKSYAGVELFGVATYGDNPEYANVAADITVLVKPNEFDALVTSISVEQLLNFRRDSVIRRTMDYLNRDFWSYFNEEEFRAYLSAKPRNPNSVFERKIKQVANELGIDISLYRKIYARPNDKNTNIEPKNLQRELTDLVPSATEIPITDGKIGGRSVTREEYIP
ncbi:hypothetical protein CMO88_03975 [Candidatus Woesearchaeota archaeon]|nr:hypothetical protein [Candidatus Woesearchaeota archaeon]|tara:strand:+ start:8439 stop:9290 length:852 start_codon:yes stop_codon:yes gene_type:complete